MTEATTIDRDKLYHLIQETSAQYEYLKKLNQSLSTGIGLLGIALSLGATVSGIIIKDARIAAIFGACAATTQAILFAYPTDRRASAYRILSAKNESLRIELEVKQQTSESLEKILCDFQFIKAQAALEETTSKKPDDSETHKTGIHEPMNHSADVNSTQPVSSSYQVSQKL
ncbi:hypothetical protein ACN4EG_27435 [Alkalinema pantanalense CENA528]|uniref:hypothetical protein n=1 Tax=Alkalinema pantanalense TaxID=1620705 RepID=UPI003D6F6E67